MKKVYLSFATILFIFLLNIHNVNAQFSFQFGSVSDEFGTDYTTVPRIGWSIDMGRTSLARLSDNSMISFGLAFMNKGFIFDTETDRFKHRNWSLNPNIGLTFMLGNGSNILDKHWLSFFYGVDVNFHYKSKIFPNKERGEKEVVHSEWFSDRVNPLMHSFGFTFLFNNGLLLHGTYYFGDFFNEDFEETIGGVTIKPYQGFSVNRFEIGFGISPIHVFRKYLK